MSQIKQLNNIYQDFCGNFTNIILIDTLLYDASNNSGNYIGITYTDSARGTWRWRIDSSAAWQILVLPNADVSTVFLSSSVQLSIAPNSSPIGSTFFLYKTYDVSSMQANGYTIQSGTVLNAANILQYSTTDNITAQLRINRSIGQQDSITAIPAIPGSWVDYINEVNNIDYKTPDIAAFFAQQGLTLPDNISITIATDKYAFSPVLRPEFTGTVPVLEQSQIFTNTPAQIIPGLNITDCLSLLDANILSNNFSDYKALSFELSAGIVPNFQIQFTTDYTNPQWTVADLTETNSVLLLDASSSIRIIPTYQNSDSVVAELIVRVWNQLNGDVGFNYTTGLATNILSLQTTTFQAPIVSAGINFNSPVIQPATITLPSILEDSSQNTPLTIAQLLTLSGIVITDADTNAQRGIAITYVGGTGNWQWRLGAGLWYNIIAANLVDNGGSNYFLLPDSAQYSIRYVPPLYESGDISFVFKAWDQTYGIVGAYVEPSMPESGQSAFSVNSVTIVQPIIHVNHAPYFSNLTPIQMTDITEDIPQLINVGATFSAIFNLAAPVVFDVDTGTRPAIAIVDLSATKPAGSWQILNGLSNTWQTVGPYTVDTGLLIDPLAATSIRFIPGPNYHGTVQFGIKAWDMSIGINGQIADTTYIADGAFSEDILYVQQTITPVNDAPILANNPIVTLDYILEDQDPQFNTGINLLDLYQNVAANTIDYDGPDVSAGFAFYSTTTTAADGVWQWCIDDVSGTAWQPIDFQQGALLLSNEAKYRVRFLPAANFAAFGTILFRAWDQTDSYVIESYNPQIVLTPNAAYSYGSGVIIQPVQNVNDIPVLENGVAVNMGTIIENISDADNQGYTTAEIATLIAPYVTDIDTADPLGIAITGTDTRNGVWQWFNVTSYLPIIGSGDYNTSQFIGMNPGTVNITVNSSATGTTVDLTNQAVVDAAVSQARWIPITTSFTSALVLSANQYDRIRFVPNANYAGDSFILINAWDQTQGQPGTFVDVLAARAAGQTTAFSEKTAIATVLISPINVAPIFSGVPLERTYILPPIEKNITIAPITILDLYTYFESNGFITDPDGPGKYIAVYSATNDIGRWEYSVNYTSFRPVWTVLDPTPTNVVHLQATRNTAVRFTGNATFEGIAQISFLLWDGTIQTFAPFLPQFQGTVAGYSVNPGFINIRVLDQLYIPPAQTNSPPIFSLIEGAPIPYDFSITASISSAANIGIGLADIYSTYILNYLLNPADIDCAVAFYSKSSDYGVWEYNIDGTSTLWEEFNGFIAESSALLFTTINSSQVRIRYRPITNNNGTDILLAKIMNVRDIGLTQQTYIDLGNYTAITSQSQLVNTVSLVRASAAPIITQDNLEVVFLLQLEDTVNNGITVTDFIAKIQQYYTAIFPESIGIAIRSYTNTIGAWQVSFNNGDAWQTIPTISGGYIYPLKGTSSTRIRFLSNPVSFGEETVTFSLWDQGIVPEAVVTAITPTVANTISFRSATQRVIVTHVNHPPVLILNPTAKLPLIIQDVVDGQNPGITMQSLFTQIAPYYIDVDAGALKGIAVLASTAASETNGTWQWRKYNDPEFNNFTTEGAYFLIGSDNNVYIRFVPNAGFYGIVNLPFVLWDQTAGYKLNYISLAEISAAISSSAGNIQQKVLSKVYVPTTVAVAGQSTNVQLIGYNG
jgi:hypothetical protein